MSRARIALGLAAGAFALLNFAYWQDPWLYRSTARMFVSGSATAEEPLLPDEEIRGDGSFVLPVAPPGARSIEPGALERMRAYAESFGSHALIVVHRGVIQYEWYAPHWGRSRLTQSQSMHKSLMGLFVGIAIADGRIGSVDEQVARWITEWAGDPRGAITLRQMLTMSSGLAQYRFTLNPLSDDLKWLNSGNSVEAILRTPLAGWAPGTRYDYNNVNSEILGVVLERAYGGRYPQLLRDRLWLPMGGERARVHTDSPGGRSYTSCCLAAPAMDWARIGVLMLRRGDVNGRRIVPAAWIDEMVRPSATSSRYGYQVRLGYDDPLLPPEGAGSTGAIAREPFLARDTYMFWGRGQQHVFVSPSRDLVIVRLGPALGRAPIRPGFDVSVLVNTAIRGMR